MSKVAVLLPAYNEEVAIASMVMLCLKHVDEVIVIDDGSKDRTSELGKLTGATVLSHSTNRGKGAALKTGFDYVKDKFDVVVTIDADGQHNPDEIPYLIKPILDNNADIVNGSRYINGHDTDTPKYRRVGQTVLDTATNIASGIKITDTQSGFRAFSNDSLNHFREIPEDFGIESDMLIEAGNAGLRVVEVEISVRYDVDGSTDNPVTHGVSVLLRILGYMRLNRPLYYYGVSGAIILFFGILITLTVYNSIYVDNLYLMGVGIFVVILGIVLLFSGLMTDVVNKFKK